MTLSFFLSSSLSLSPSFFHSLHLSISFYLSLIFCFSLSVSYSLCFSLSSSVSLSLSLSLTHTLSLSHFLSLSLSLSFFRILEHMDDPDFNNLILDPDAATSGSGSVSGTIVDQRNGGGVSSNLSLSFIMILSFNNYF